MSALSAVTPPDLTLQQLGDVQRGSLQGDTARNDNTRIKRYVAKYTINPAIAHGIAHEVGSLEVGKRADIAVWDVAGIEAAGSWDPVASLVLCGPTRVRDLFVEGRQVVRGGQMATIDLPRVIERQNRLAARLMG